MSNDVSVCYYCGVLADSIDHTVPQHLLVRAGAAGLDLRGVMRMRRWTVDACRECNTLIGGAIFRTMRERSDFLKSRLRSKYRKVLRMPNWTPAELDTLGPVIRKDVESALAKRDSVKLRIAWKPSHYAEDPSEVMFLFKDLTNKAAS